MATRTTGTTRTPAQVFALVFGVVYLLIGLVGFAVTGFDDFAAKTFDEKLLIFPVNPLHNLVHIAIGGLWLYGAKDHPTAKSVNVVIGVAYLGVFLLGLLGVLDFLAIKDAGSADNYLHLASGLLAVYFGTAGAAGPSTSRTAA
jgi:RsiW-degrading membrane proteinase PrsW (M82 family)